MGSAQNGPVVRPLQLLDTGVQVAVSELIGSRSDYRVIEALSSPQEIFDCTSDSEIWIDYVADLGDAWDSTYAIASTIAAKQLELRAGAAGAVATARGSILIMSKSIRWQTVMPIRNEP